ncbi:hypothetical protein EJF36_16710 [Bacillus sp. HMF5848]|uniref:hypothetical protein n=1 Tax=Bacillus sp. HMF5848 TaxID=2495421 RepID=UPI000F771986|nr:hypothetical protein [Bacillus sp. HMF5848]RSK28373.1 hypothetical protein EJF36_16710 [Bacillus sp. HMF5848]
MLVLFEKHIGQQLDIIYMDRLNRLSQRTITIREIKNERLYAYCYTKRAPRIFALKNVLAATVRKRAV